MAVIADFLQKEHVILWLKSEGFLDKLQCAWLTPQSHDATLILDEASVFELVEHLRVRAIHVLGQTGISERDVVKEFLPSPLFNQLLGTVVPWEIDAIDGSGSGIPLGTQKLSTSHQIKFPLLLQKEAHQLLHFLTKKLKEALSPDNIDNLFKPKKLIPWNEFIACLPELPDSLRGEEAFDLFNSECEKDKLFYVHFSKKTKGLYYRVLCNNFNAFIDQLKLWTEKQAKSLHEEAELKAYLEKAANVLEEFRVLQHALIAKFSVLCETLAQAPELKGFGEDPFTVLGTPKLFFDQVAVPILFDVPKLPFPESDTVLVLDGSISMVISKPGGVSRMDVLKSENGLQKALTQLSKKPNQFLIFVVYQGDSGYNVRFVIQDEILDRVPITPETLPGIVEAIKGIQVRSGTPGIPGLRQALQTLAKHPKTNARILLATDGIWNEVSSDPGKSLVLDPKLFPKFKKDLRDLFKAFTLLPMDIVGMDLHPNLPESQFLRMVAGMSEEGSQMVFVSTDKLGEEINDLMLMKQFRFLDKVEITYSVLGCSIETQVMSPFFTNLVKLRHLFVPSHVIQAALNADFDEIEVSIEITYDDKTKAIRHHVLSANLLQATFEQTVGDPIGDYEKREMIEEWIDEQIYAQGVLRRSHFNLLSGTEQFDIYSKIFLEAIEHPAMMEIHHILRVRMERCAEDWINERYSILAVEAGLPSNEEILKRSEEEQNAFFKLTTNVLQKIQSELESMSLQQAWERMHERLRSHCSDWLGRSLCLAAEIPFQVDFTKIPPRAQYEAIMKVAAKVDELGLNDLMSDVLNILILPIWLEANLCIQGKVKDLKEFFLLPRQEILAILRSLREEAEALEHPQGVLDIDAFLLQVEEAGDQPLSEILFPKTDPDNENENENVRRQTRARSLGEAAGAMNHQLVLHAALTADERAVASLNAYKQDAPYAIVIYPESRSL